MGYYNTFVVKIWCNNHGEMVRGHTQHVSSQEHAYFSSLENMSDFIASHLESPPNASVTQNNRQDGLSLLAEGIGHIGQDE